MWIDGLIGRHPRVRDALIRLIPSTPRTVTILNRTFQISLRSEIGMARLARVMALSPMHFEISALFSLAGLAPIGGTFIDVGANVGLFSVPMASLGDLLGFRVLAIEPHPETAARLRANLAPYACASVLTAAASRDAGTVPMGYQSFETSVTFRVVTTPDARAFDVPTVRLADLDVPAPWTLKIDVEDHERATLDGLLPAIHDGRVRAVMFDSFSHDATIPGDLAAVGFELRDGRSLEPFVVATGFNLLATKCTR